MGGMRQDACSVGTAGRQQADAQAFQQGLQAMSMHYEILHGLQGIDLFATCSSAHCNKSWADTATHDQLHVCPADAAGAAAG